MNIPEGRDPITRKASFDILYALCNNKIVPNSDLDKAITEYGPNRRQCRRLVRPLQNHDQWRIIGRTLSDNHELLRVKYFLKAPSKRCRLYATNVPHMAVDALVDLFCTDLVEMSKVLESLHNAGMWLAFMDVNNPRHKPVIEYIVWAFHQDIKYDDSTNDAVIQFMLKHDCLYMGDPRLCDLYMSHMSARRRRIYYGRVIMEARYSPNKQTLYSWLMRQEKEIDDVVEHLDTRAFSGGEIDMIRREWSGIVRRESAAGN